MAHELLIGGDGKAAMFYVGEMPWHKLGIELKQPPTAAQAIKAARLDWKVAKVPLFYHESMERVGVVPDLHAVIPTEGWEQKHDTIFEEKEARPVFGVVSDQYKPLQNSEAFSFFDPLIDKGEATYETAGALGKGERVWVLAKLTNPIDIKGDKTDKYLLLSNSHDGKSSVQIKYTPIRVVCNNTLSWALAQNANYQVAHTQKLPEKMKQAQELFERIACEYADIEKKFKKLADIPIQDEKRLNSYLTLVYPEPAKPDVKGKVKEWERRVETIKRDRACSAWLFQNPRRQPVKEVRNTLWTAYNAVTEYVDHCISPAKSRFFSPAVHLNSIWFGSRAATKVNAFKVAGECATLWLNEKRGGTVGPLSGTTSLLANLS
jgi:phage/plasmid-like protein (TIGR03299 family)